MGHPWFSKEIVEDDNQIIIGHDPMWKTILVIFIVANLSFHFIIQAEFNISIINFVVTSPDSESFPYFFGSWILLAIFNPIMLWATYDRFFSNRIVFELKSRQIQINNRKREFSYSFDDFDALVVHNEGLDPKYLFLRSGNSFLNLLNTDDMDNPEQEFSQLHQRIADLLELETEKTKGLLDKYNWMTDHPRIKS